MNTSRSGLSGFTLIELLVVIAIIGILSSVVLASLNTARMKGADAAIRSNLSSSRAQAELYSDANGVNGFNGVCGNTAVANVKPIYSMVLAAARAYGLGSFAVDTIGTGSNAVCIDTAGGWAAQVPLKAVANTWHCVDYTGLATTTSASRITSTTDVDCST